jgi:hypothetical protein
VARGVVQDVHFRDEGVVQTGAPGVVQTGAPYSLSNSMNKNALASLALSPQGEFDEEREGPTNGSDASSSAQQLVAIKRGSVEMRALLAHPAREKYARDGGLYAAVVPADEWGAIWSRFNERGAKEAEEAQDVEPRTNE